MNRLYFGDNLHVLGEYVQDESVDLIYLDPPFNSNRLYNMPHKSGEQERAFDDIWTWDQHTQALYEQIIAGADAKMADVASALYTLLGQGNMASYLVNMAARLIEMRRVLKSTGSIYLHCDPTASHYLKIIMDVVFGAKNFRNEIVWCYTGPGSPHIKQFLRKHDIILWYSKSDVWTFNRDAVRMAHSAKTKANYKAGNKGSGFIEDPTLGDDDVLAADGKVPEDWWQFAIAPRGKEYLGYPTQKPRKLLTRIVAASSNPGDVVLDPFCGCGTTLEACIRLGDRKWVGIDIAKVAIDVIEKRLADMGYPRDRYEVAGIPESVKAAKYLWEQSPLAFERWAVKQFGGITPGRQTGDKGVDGKAFFTDAQGQRQTIVASVKGGATVHPHQARELRGVIERTGAAMGALIMFGPISQGVREEMNHSGTYRNGETDYPKMQVVTVRQLINNPRPFDGPPLLNGYPRISTSQLELKI
jgi:DNA modification methylase